jgi:hypothetical protein
MVGILEALSDVLLEQAQCDGFGRRIHVASDRARLGRRRRALHLEERFAVVRAKRQLAGEHLEEEDAHRVKIGLRSGVLATRLLRRHVLRRSEHGALGREPRVARETRETEVEDLHEVFAAAADGEKDVVALQVAMHDAEVVGAREGGAHLLENVDAARERHRAARELGRERRADQVFHDEIQLAVLGFADVVDVDDVRVIDAVGRARFAKHPRSKVRLATQVGANEFEGDDALDEHVPRPVHDPHSAFAEPRLETVSSGDDFSEHGIVGARST